MAAPRFSISEARVTTSGSGIIKHYIMKNVKHQTYANRFTRRLVVGCLLSGLLVFASVIPSGRAQTRPVTVAPGFEFNVFADPVKVPDFAFNAFSGPT